MGRITSTQAPFFSPGTNWAGEKGKKKKDKNKVGWPMGYKNTAVRKQKEKIWL